MFGREEYIWPMISVSVSSVADAQGRLGLCASEARARESLLES